MKNFVIINMCGCISSTTKKQPKITVRRRDPSTGSIKTIELEPSTVTEIQSGPNRKLVHAYLEYEKHRMHRRIKNLYECVVSEEELNQESISLNFIHLHSKTVKQLKRILGLFQNTKKLLMWKTKTGPDEILALNNEIKQLKQLETLSLPNNDVQYQGGLYLGDILPYLPNLKELFLHDNHLGTDGFKFLSVGIKSLQALQKITLDENLGKNKGSEYVLKALGNCKDIQYVGLGFNGITQEIGPCLRTFLKGATKLETLVLRGNPLPMDFVCNLKVKEELIEM